MTSSKLTRRQALSMGALALGSAVAGKLHAASSKESKNRSSRVGDDFFAISLNTSTLRGHKLPLTEVIDIAAKAGYAGIEPWPDELDRHVEAGGTLKDIDRRLKDLGLKVTGAIAFFRWMVDDDSQRARGFEEARRHMEKLSQIGASHVAAPPAGAYVREVVGSVAQQPGRASVPRRPVDALRPQRLLSGITGSRDGPLPEPDRLLAPLCSNRGGSGQPGYVLLVLPPIDLVQPQRGDRCQVEKQQRRRVQQTELANRFGIDGARPRPLGELHQPQHSARQQNAQAMDRLASESLGGEEHALRASPSA